MITPNYGLDGLLDKVKGRLVACGDEVDPSAYKSASETSAPTLKFESLMVKLSAASFLNAIMGTIDYPGAFLNAILTRIQYMLLGKDSAETLCRQYLEYVRMRRKDGTMIVIVKRAHCMDYLNLVSDGMTVCLSS